MVEPRIREEWPNVIVAPELLNPRGIPRSVTVTFIIRQLPPAIKEGQTLPGETEPKILSAERRGPYKLYPERLKDNYGIFGIIHIGRAEHNDIVLEDPQVSREHGDVILRYDLDAQRFAFLYEDHSGNGTKLNGIFFRGKRKPLRKNDKLRLGSMLEIEFNYEESY